MASSQIIVSPGVYSTETTLTYVAQSLGVTTLGVVGETPKGPAFEPVFIKNFDEYMTYFGAPNPAKYPYLNNLPKFEMPYIAQQYLAQSNQLWVTRLLGLSGYNAGKAWVITSYAGMDFSTIGATGSTAVVASGSSCVNYVDDGGVKLLISSNSTFGVFYTGNTFAADGVYIYSTAGSGTDNHVTTADIMGGSISFSAYVKSDLASCAYKVMYGTITGSSTSNACISGAQIRDASCLSDYEGLVVATLRSRTETTSDYDLKTTAPYLVDNDSAANNVFFVNVSAQNNPYGEFTLSGWTNNTVPELFEYTTSLDGTKKNFISKVLGGAGVSQNCVFCDGWKSKSEPIWVEEIYPEVYKHLVDYEKIIGVQGVVRVDDGDGTVSDTGISNYGYVDSTGDAPIGYETPETPYIVSELRSGKVQRLFKFIMISDGEAANVEVKISFVNISLEDGTFDVIIRAWDDTDDKLKVLEKFGGVNLVKSDLTNYIGRRIGTADGEFQLKSKYVMLVLNPQHPEDAVPAGFEGYPMRFDQVTSLTGNYTGAANPLRNMRPVYKTRYYDVGNVVYYNPISGYEIQSTGDNAPFYRKKYLGLTRTVGIDPATMAYKGYTEAGAAWSTLSKGFHMDKNAASAYILAVSTPDLAMPENQEGFEVGVTQFTDANALEGTQYETLSACKFTVAPYGGFDGWDENRGKRTNGDNYRFGKLAYTNSGFLGNTSDYYAYLEGIETFNNAEAININVFASPGIDYVNNNALVKASIEMVEETRADSFYVVTTPDVDYRLGTVYSPLDAVDNLDAANLDTNYTATYYPWIKFNDQLNNKTIYIPPTAEVCRNLALTDNVAYPWFSTAGYTRGLVNALRARLKLTGADRDYLYENRINPIATFNDVGVVIWGNKTLQVKESPLDRINVRRLLLQTRKLIANAVKRLLFEQNDDVVRNEFLNMVNPILDNIKNQRGLTEFRVKLVDSPEHRDQLKMEGKIFLKPTRALEFIELEFTVTPQSVSFENI